MSESRYPAGWDQNRVRRVLKQYEQQSDDEAEADDEAPTHTAMDVPVDLVPAIRELIATHRTMN